MTQLPMVNRNTNLDFLRFIGISCIILAHMGVPGIIFQARNFDVPLMVLLSGISFSQFSSKNYSHYRNYLYSRFLRLIIPTWIFLVFYNYVNYLGSSEIPSLYNLFLQFSLTAGSNIGIWIIRIFFSMAIIAPLLLKINNKIDSNKSFYIMTIFTYIIYEVLLYNSKQFLPENIFKITKLVIFFTVSYGLIFLYGVRLSSLNKRSIQSHIFLFSVIFISYLIFILIQNDKFIPTQQFKYPPQIYYLSYALFISTALYYITKFNQIIIEKFNLFQFIGRSTLWIYLWHWFFIKLYNYCKFDFNFLLKYILIYTITIMLVYIQTKFIHLVASNTLLQKKQNKLIIKVFTG